MVQSVLGSLILGYRPLWNQARKLAAIQLYVHPEASATVNTAHLLRTLQELWTASSPPILLSPQNQQLLCDMLDNAPRGTPWIEVRGEWLANSAIYSRVRAAHQRGLKLVWRGELGQLPERDGGDGEAGQLGHRLVERRLPAHRSEERGQGEQGGDDPGRASLGDGDQGGDPDDRDADQQRIQQAHDGSPRRLERFFHAPIEGKRPRG